MAEATLSTMSEILKVFYLPAINEQLNKEKTLSAVLETTTEGIEGKQATIQCHYGRSGATGARADGGALPVSDYQKYKTATIPMRYMYATGAVTGPTIAATKTDRGSYVRALDAEMTGIVEDLAQEVNRMYHGCGYGVVARWRTTASGTSYTLQKSYRGNTAGGDGFGSTFGGKYLKENGRAVPVVITTDGTNITATTVDSTDIAVSAVTEGSTEEGGYDTITCTDPSVTEAAGTWYVRGDANGQSYRSETSATAAGYGRLEPVGLRGIITDTDLDDIALYDGTTTNKGLQTPNDPFQGLDVSTYSWWKAQVLSHSAGRYLGQRALTLDLMDRMEDKIADVVGEEVGPNLIVMPRAIRREYLALLRADRIYTEMPQDGGIKKSGLKHNGISIRVDKDAIDGEIYFLTTDTIKIYSMSDYEFMEKDGSILSRISGYDKYEFALFRYAELGCTRRNANGVITDIAYTL